MEIKTNNHDSDQITLESILKSLGNPIRIKILSQLATGDKFVMQLVQSLGKSQQDIHRNLNFLEKLGIVRSYMVPYKLYKTSQTKPSKGRRYFSINHSFMLQINLAPSFFNLEFEAIPLEQFHLKSQGEKNKFADLPANVHVKSVSELSQDLLEEKKKLKLLQERQYSIFLLQNKLQNIIIDHLNQMELNLTQSIVLNKLIGSEPLELDTLALDLNLHPEKLRDILDSLKDKIPLKTTKHGWSL